ncbi:hypothetical protein KCG44_10190 [Pacificimonas sp. WHA3]|uniref:Uncharacterized protein n=1 Tax=Pacificimonas pallii TaxID=2827236 RepID=A0ABS6SFG1_9SPHN|nr:hypothetical protein [Pacificimonas pallii]MBV7257150.1 hypothetical protein [Pacificimonas pallii]
MSVVELVRKPISLPEALADELGIASRLLADLAYDLGADEETLRRHLVSIQKIDQVTQMLLIVADLLKTLEEPEQSLESVTLADMAERLRGAVGVG